MNAFITAVETAILDGRREILLAMATGTGKTRTATGLCYRLLASKRVRRILFLVDRTSLGVQASDAFKGARIETGKTFADIYELKELHRDHPEQIVKRVETILGRIDVSLQLDARAVVVAAHPESERFADKLTEIAEFVRSSHGEKLRIVRAPVTKRGQAPSMCEVEACIRRDVG